MASEFLASEVTVVLMVKCRTLDDDRSHPVLVGDLASQDTHGEAASEVYSACQQ